MFCMAEFVVTAPPRVSTRCERVAPSAKGAHTGDVAVRAAEGSPLPANDVQYAMASDESAVSV